MAGFYVYYGELFNDYTGVPLKHPAVLVDRDNDILHKIGEYDHLLLEEARFAKGMKILGDGYSTFLISLANLSKEEACYVIRRMQEYTASGFVRKFAEKVFDADVKDWLMSEMERIPLAVTKEEQEVER